MAIKINFPARVVEIHPVKKIGKSLKVQNIIISDQDVIQEQFIEVEFSNGRIDNLSGVSVGDEVDLSCMLRGHYGKGNTSKVFNKISAYSIKKK